MLRLEAQCSLCNQEEENIVHLFWLCPLTVDIWREIKSWWNIDLSTGIIPNDFMSIVFHREIKLVHREIWYIAVILTWWHIWKVINNVIFQGVKFEPIKVLILIKRETLCMCSNQGWLSSKDSNMWFIDPVEAIQKVTISKKLQFILNLLLEFEAVGFSDGAWRVKDSKGGMVE